MTSSERADRTRRNLEFSTRLTTTNWAMHVLHDLKAVEKNVDPSENFSVGFGMGYRVVGVKAGFQPLDSTSISKAYKAAHCRLILLDWGGTLVSDADKSDKLHAYAMAVGQASRERPSEALTDALETLCLDFRNVVFVMSGKELYAVQEFFGDIKGLGLGAEHGFYYRWPREDGLGSGKWQTMLNLGDQSWKEAAKMIMDIYIERTHGTYIEQKGSALIWQFRDADPEFGYMQSKELEEHLLSVLPMDVVEVLRGGGASDGYIEVRPAGVSKGLFLHHALATMKTLNREVDFILAVGDDVSDEPMFQEIAKLPNSGACVEKSTAFGVTVGKKPTAAQSYVDDPQAVMELLTTLIRTSQRDKRHFSAVDLPSFASSGSSALAASTSARNSLTPSSLKTVRPDFR